MVKSNILCLGLIPKREGGDDLRDFDRPRTYYVYNRMGRKSIQVQLTRPLSPARA